MVFAPDHSIWTAGYQTGNDHAQDFKVLHHYARTGEELGETLSWSQVGGDLKRPVIEFTLGRPLLYVADDRIGWNAALHPGFRTWIEVSFSGNLLGKFDLKTQDGKALMPVAMTSSGNVYAMIPKSYSARFAVLVRSKGNWQKVAGDPHGVLIGADRENLVFSELNGNQTTLKFAPCGSLRAE